jgi:threonine/homoserine/homoserine lactone efflux protein
MGLSTLRDKEALAVPADQPSPSIRKVVRNGILLNLLNPKLTIFFFAFLPQFVKPSSPGATLHMIALSAIFMVITFLVFVVYGKFAAAFRDRVINRPRVATWLRRTFAGSFAALAVTLAVSSE